MSEDKPATRNSDPVRVIDRRSFTAEGERRDPNLRDEPAPSAPSAPSPLASASPSAHEPRHDPVASAHFQNLVVNLARQAAANLGSARHPLSGQIEVDLEGAQQMIDLLQALREKTRSNLTAEEKELLEGLIGDLQMQFVAVRSKASRKP
jgi:DNA replication initiation complex subunit (GINS family)